MRNRNGFTLIESLIVAGIVAIMVMVVVVNLGNKGQKDFRVTVEKIIAVLHDARDRSIVLEGDAEWSVLFSDATTTPAFIDYCHSFGVYFDRFVLRADAVSRAVFSLPESVSFDSSISTGGFLYDWSACIKPAKAITFLKGTGKPKNPAEAWVRVYMTGSPNVSTTISVSPLGVIDYTTSSFWSGLN